MAMGVNGTRGMFRGIRPSLETGAKGVRGVLGVEMYRPLHLGQRAGLSVGIGALG
jgi:hypothetical protein